MIFRELVLRWRRRAIIRRWGTGRSDYSTARWQLERLARRL